MQTPAESQELLDAEKPDKERRGRGSRRDKLTNIVIDQDEAQTQKEVDANNG